MHRFDYSIPKFSTRIQGIWMVVTPDIVSEVLHVPRVAHPNYPSSKHLRIVSKDELLSLFCETPSWGDRHNTSCSAFAKGPRILNMVMTFILHPLSHYNTCTASLEAALDRDNSSSNFYRSIHLRSFFFNRWSDIWGHHDTACAHGCSPWHS